ncbi:hypothetical protein HYU18_00835 [Candidatus Woesearchaeota archaeon]|nr:hypothetical protein [Candidatus Woesearchaeota archaeon]
MSEMTIREIVNSGGEKIIVHNLGKNPEPDGRNIAIREAYKEWDNKKRRNRLFLVSFTIAAIIILVTIVKSQ